MWDRCPRLSNVEQTFPSVLAYRLALAYRRLHVWPWRTAGFTSGPGVPQASRLPGVPQASRLPWRTAGVSPALVLDTDWSAMRKNKAGGTPAVQNRALLSP